MCEPSEIQVVQLSSAGAESQSDSVSKELSVVTTAKSAERPAGAKPRNTAITRSRKIKCQIKSNLPEVHAEAAEIHSVNTTVITAVAKSAATVKTATMRLSMGSIKTRTYISADRL